MGTPERQTLAGTQSVCPVCLKLVDAAVVAVAGTVFLEKSCAGHGSWQVPLWRGGPAYKDWRRPKAPAHLKLCYAEVKDGCPYDCGLCAEHRQHPCSVLLEITQHCTLGCPVCFADVGNEKERTGMDPDLEAIGVWYDRALAAAGPCNIQLSGGEPTLRSDLPEIIALGVAKGFSFIQLNTNGLRLAEEPGYAKTLAKAGLSTVFLQFDGTEDRIHSSLRGRPLAREKAEAIERCGEAGLGVVLVPTLVPGVNTDNIGAIIRFALSKLPLVRGVHFQPISHFGRYTQVAPSRERFTLPEVMQAIEKQTDGLLKVSDFTPPGGEHARCSFHGSFFLLPDGRLRRTSPSLASCCGTQDGEEEPATSCCGTQDGQRGLLRTIGSVARQWAAPAGGAAVGSGSADGTGRGLDSAVSPPGSRGEGSRSETGGSASRPKHPPASLRSASPLFHRGDSTSIGADGALDLDAFLERATTYSLSVSCMAFQDAWNLDLERLRDCCISVMSPEGRLIPFCAYNLTSETGETLYRHRKEQLA